MNPPVPMTSISTSEGGQSLSHAHEITALRTQIMANATLLFWPTRPNGATTLMSEVGVMTGHSGDGYTAVLTVPKGIGRCWSVAAQGHNSETVVAALRSLLDVTAAALAKYQGNVVKPPSNPSEIAGGLVDEGLLKAGREKAWGGFLG